MVRVRTVTLCTSLILISMFLGCTPAEQPGYAHAAVPPSRGARLTPYEASQSPPTLPSPKPILAALKFNNCDLAYRSPISREKAVELGEYLVQEKFCSGTHKISAEITGALNKVQFRFVVKEGYENRAKYIKIVRLFSGMIARAVFPDSNFEIHLCDSKMNTLRVIKH